MMETIIIEKCLTKKIANAVITKAAYLSQCVPESSRLFLSKLELLI